MAKYVLGRMVEEGFPGGDHSQAAQEKSLLSKQPARGHCTSMNRFAAWKKSSNLKSSSFIMAVYRLKPVSIL